MEPGLSAARSHVAALEQDRYPLTAGYDPQWLLSLDMGPNPLWLLEDLSRSLHLKAGDRILDLGSGNGATSVFLAKEFGVQVVAADWWVDPSDAAKVFEAAGVADRVLAVKAEAHNLPFARHSFDAVVSIDAFEYFGTADSYISYLAGFVKPGGEIGMATPALRHEVSQTGVIPPHVNQVVGGEALAWHTPQWWRFQWQTSGSVTVTDARRQVDGWHDWLLWSRAVAEAAGRPITEDAVVTMLEADHGRDLGFALITATVN